MLRCKKYSYLFIITLLWVSVFAYVVVAAYYDALPRNRLTITPMLAMQTSSYDSEYQWYEDVSWMFTPALISIGVLMVVGLPMLVLFARGKFSKKIRKTWLTLHVVLLCVSVLPVLNMVNIIRSHWPSEVFLSTYVPDIYPVMDAILEHDDPNYEDVYGFHPLDAAAWHCEPEAARYLIGRGAELEAVNHRGRTPLVAALSTHLGLRGKSYPRQKCLDTIALLIEKGAKVDVQVGLQSPFSLALRRALLFKDMDALALIIPHSKKLNAHLELQDDYFESDKTALIHAIQYRNAPLMRLLIEAGADVNEPDAAGKMPMTYAVEPLPMHLVPMMQKFKIVPTKTEFELVKGVLKAAGAKHVADDVAKKEIE